MKQKELQTYEYGIMSTRYAIKAKTKYIAYATMCLHLQKNVNMIAIYTPESSKQDSWINLEGKTNIILDKLFSDFGGFEEFLKSNVKDIRACYKTVKKII